MLSSFDAADLVVYKNKESFDKRDSKVEQEREEPLEVDSVVYGLGTTKIEALIVVVPPLFMTTWNNCKGYVEILISGPIFNDSMDVDQSMTQTSVSQQ